MAGQVDQQTTQPDKQFVVYVDRRFTHSKLLVIEFEEFGFYPSTVCDGMGLFAQPAIVYIDRPMVQAA